MVGWPDVCGGFGEVREGLGASLRLLVSQTSPASKEGLVLLPLVPSHLNMYLGPQAV